MVCDVMNELIFDQESLFDRFGGDGSVLIEIFEAYFEEQPELRNALEVAIASNDHESIRRAAHAIKGSFLNVCGNESASLAANLEEKASREVGSYEEIHQALSVSMLESNKRVLKLFEELKMIHNSK